MFLSAATGSKVRMLTFWPTLVDGSKLCAGASLFGGQARYYGGVSLLFSTPSRLWSPRLWTFSRWMATTYFSTAALDIHRKKKPPWKKSYFCLSSMCLQLTAEEASYDIGSIIFDDHQKCPPLAVWSVVIIDILPAKNSGKSVPKSFYFYAGDRKIVFLIEKMYFVRNKLRFRYTLF